MNPEEQHRAMLTLDLLRSLEEAIDLLNKVLPSHRLRKKKITRNTRLGEDLGCDSIDGMEIVIGLDEMLGIDITDAEAEKIKTVGDIARIIQEKENPALE